MEIFKRKGLNRMKRAPKYQCTICNRMFKGKRSRDNHMIKAKCRPKHGNNNNIIEQIVIIEPELVSLKPEIEHSEPSTYENQYYGRTYNYVNIPTGNRHLRAGIPLPRISKYERAAI